VVATVDPAKKVTAVLEVLTIAPAVKDLTSLMPPNLIASHARKARTNKNLLKPCVLAVRPATSAPKERRTPSPVKMVLILKKDHQAVLLVTSTWTTMKRKRNVPAGFPSSPTPTENAHAKQVTR
jgi:hypothetical protein